MWPLQWKDPVYFKSTDGHTGHYNFSLRRLNLHLIDALSDCGGCFIVDSTKRGKRFPDSFTKTIPIWCCVVNRAVFSYRRSRNEDIDAEHWDTGLHLHPNIPPSEISVIKNLISEKFLPMFMSSIDVSVLSGKLRKPIRPLWFSQDTRLFTNSLPDYRESSFAPIICLSASRLITGRTALQKDEGFMSENCRENGWVYIQGAGDDDEFWNMGLSPQMFYKHKDTILRSEVTCEAEIRRIVADNSASLDILANLSTVLQAEPRFVFLGETGIAVGNITSIFSSSFDILINASDIDVRKNFDRTLSPYYCSLPNVAVQPYLFLNLPTKTKSQLPAYYSSIPSILNFYQAQLSRFSDSLDGPVRLPSVLVFSTEGKERAVMAALPILVTFFDVKMKLRQCPIPIGLSRDSSQTFDAESTINKELIMQKLSFISSFWGVANPSRAIIKQINSFYLSSPFMEAKCRDSSG
ncbi:tRNA A64-2'-O-ribosylphosphate transferase [Paraphysoderma sedebokerense]|nr:tRNA A64-2'-O-ribosylphosphate transferase [Paraphysoderma sedebokerense]